MKPSFLIFTVFVIFSSDCKKLPSNFIKCNRKDADFKECVLRAAQDGLPQLVKPFKEIGVSSIDPIEVLELKIKAGTQAVAVDQNFKNCKFYGVEKTVLKKFDINFKEHTVYAQGFMPEIRKLCEYDLDGKILLFPIKGQGDSTIILKNVTIDVVIPFKEIKRNGKNFLRFSDSTMHFELEHVSFNFENLFNGDKALGDNINKVLNENWKEVFDDVKGDYEKALALVLESLVNGFFSKISLEEAFD